MQTENQQEIQLLTGFRQMTSEAKDELLRFVISSMVRPAPVVERPQLRIINGKNNP
jgi:hypothetical protein